MGDSENLPPSNSAHTPPWSDVPTGWLNTSDQPRPQPPFPQYDFSQAAPPFFHAPHIRRQRNFIAGVETGPIGSPPTLMEPDRLRLSRPASRRQERLPTRQSITRPVFKSLSADCWNDPTIFGQRHEVSPTHSKNRTNLASLHNTRIYETFLSRWPPASPIWLMHWTEHSVPQQALPHHRQNRFSLARLPRSLVGFKI